MSTSRNKKYVWYHTWVNKASWQMYETLKSAGGYVCTICTENLHQWVSTRHSKLPTWCMAYFIVRCMVYGMVWYPLYLRSRHLRRRSGVRVARPGKRRLGEGEGGRRTRGGGGWSPPRSGGGRRSDDTPPPRYDSLEIRSRGGEGRNSKERSVLL